MPARNNTNRYGSLSIGLHWLMLVLIAVVYALMVGMPILGWLILSAQGKAVPFFGLQLPQLVTESKSVAEWVKELHEGGGTVGYFLIGIHAAAALFHHYVVKDNTLQRMLPHRD